MKITINAKRLNQNRSIRRMGKRRSIGVFFLILFTFFAFFVHENPFLFKDVAHKQLDANLIVSGYWVLTDPIVIDDLGANDWAWTAATYDWCSGEGTLVNPYRIENVMINGDNLTSCIEIWNSNRFFIVRNCTLIKSYRGVSPYYEAGIKLVNVTNGQVKQNNCSTNNGAGVFLYESHHNNVSKNIAQDNLYGIALFRSHHINISGNEVKGNKQGIRLLESNDNVISGNTASDNNSIGIFVCSNNNDNIVLGNIVYNNNYGIYIWMNCDRNNFSRNIVGRNREIGMFLWDSCDDNLIFHNFFFKNNENAVPWDEGNQWDNGSIGNYWDDYLGTDDDDDGIGDTPYTISVDPLVQDRYPLIVLDMHPIASFLVSSKRIYEGESVQFTFNGTLGNILTTFQWDFGDDGPGSTDQNPVHRFSIEGEYAVKLTLTDSDDEVNSTEVIVIVVKKRSANEGPFSSLTIALTIIGVSAVLGVITVGFVFNKKRGRSKA